MKVCVIQNGVADAQNDILDTHEIKQIFTSFNNQDNFEIHHNNLPVSEVSVLENYISTIDEDIAGTIVPKGSWNAVIRVDNPDIQKMLMDGVFGGVSLNNRINESCSTGLMGKYHSYKELRSAECVIPLFISFVEAPSNGVGLHIMDYDMYILKSRDGVKTMSFLDKVKALIKEEEANEVSVIEKDATPVTDKDAETKSESDVKVIEKADKPVEDEEPKKEDEEVVEETVEEETVVEEEQPKKEEEADEVIEKECKDEEIIKKEEDDNNTEEVIEKAEEPTEKAEEVVEEATEEVDEAIDYEARIKNLEDKVAELEAKLLDVKAEPTTDSSEPVEPVITKSAKIEVTETVQSQNIYQLTGRDPVTGKKLRKQSKVLN